MHSVQIGFIGSLLITVAMLIGALITGRRRAIRGHVCFVAMAVGMLGVSIAFAIETGPLYHLDRAGWITPVHLTLAKVTAACYLWPLITGPLAHRDRIPRRVHRTGAWAALLLTLASTVTGCWMLAAAPLKSTVDSGPGEVRAQ